MTETPPNAGNTMPEVGELPIIYHGTPLTPRSALLDVCNGRAMCVSFWRPDDVEVVEAISPASMFDSGAFSEWQAAKKRGDDWFIRDNWKPYFDWLEPRLKPGRWAVMPDAPGAPSQLNDALLSEWPFGQWGAPLWHMDAPLDRLLRLCDRHDRVCLGWTGGGKHLDRPDYHERMAEVDKALGNRWPNIHMMRGIAVARMWPFTSADGTTLAQNGWRYDSPIDECTGDRWRGRRAYADRLEGLNRGFGGLERGPSLKGRRNARPHLGSNVLVDGFAGCSSEASGTGQVSFNF